MSKTIDSYTIMLDDTTNEHVVFEDYGTDDSKEHGRFATSLEARNHLLTLKAKLKDGIGGVNKKLEGADPRYKLLNYYSQKIIETVELLIERRSQGEVETKWGVLLDQLIELQGGHLTFIKSIETMNTGGGCMVDMLILEDGRVIALNDEICALYPSMQEFSEGDGIDTQSIELCNQDNPLCYLDQDNIHDKKIFLCYWSKDAFSLKGEGEDEFRVERISLFCDDNCYDQDEIAEIKKLEVNDEWQSHDYGDYHTVRRLA